METREPLTSAITRDLREAILEGRLRPGDRLPQESLATRYQASRVPVQQALRELANEGLVTIAPNAGARVARLDLNELVDIYRAREAIEPMVLEESVAHLSDEALRRIEALVEDTEACAARGDRLGYVECDRPLHFAMFAGAAMPRLLRVIAGFWDTTQHYRRVYGLVPAAVETSVIEHRLLLGLIRERNADDAASLLRIHIRRTRLGLAQRAELLEGEWMATSNGSSNGTSSG